MSTPKIEKLSAALFGKARRAVLGLLYSRPEEAYYLRQIARATGVGLGAVQREVHRLSQAGIIQRVVRGRQVYFQAAPECPVFAELKSLVVKTVGVVEVLRAALTPLSDRVQAAFVYGSVARGEQCTGSDVDVLIVGSATFAEVVAALSPCQEKLGREINPTVYPPDEFKTKVAAEHHFLKSVLARPKLFLMGGEHDLAGLAGKRLAD